MTSFGRTATIPASTKRATISGGKRGDPVTLIDSLYCTPLDPPRQETLQRVNLDSPYELLETFTHGNQDIKIGDVLVVSGSSYSVRYVGDWIWRDAKFLHLLIEESQR